MHVIRPRSRAPAEVGKFKPGNQLKHESNRSGQLNFGLDLKEQLVRQILPEGGNSFTHSKQDLQD